MPDPTIDTLLSEAQVTKTEDSPISHSFYEYRTAFFDTQTPTFTYRGKNCQHVVAIDANCMNAVSRATCRYAITVILFSCWCRDRKSVVARNKEGWARDRGSFIDISTQHIRRVVLELPRSIPA